METGGGSTTHGMGPRSPPLHWSSSQCMTAVGSANQARRPKGEVPRGPTTRGGRAHATTDALWSRPSGGDRARPRAHPRAVEGVPVPTAAHTHGPSSAGWPPFLGASAQAPPPISKPNFPHISGARVPPNTSATAGGPKRLIRPRNLCIIASGLVVGMEDGGQGGGGGAPPQGLRWRLALSRARRPSPRTTLALSLPVQTPGSTGARGCPLFLGHGEMEDDARRWGQRQPSPPPPRDRTPSCGCDPAQGGCPGGTSPPTRPLPPLLARASNVDAWPLGRHRPCPAGGRRGRLVSSRQLVWLAREHGCGRPHIRPAYVPGLPVTRPGERVGVNYRAPRRAWRPASTPRRPKQKLGAPQIFSANRHQPNGAPPWRTKAAGEGCVPSLDWLGSCLSWGEELEWTSRSPPLLWRCPTATSASEGAGPAFGSCTPGARTKGTPCTYVGACSVAHDGRTVQTRCLLLLSHGHVGGGGPARCWLLLSHGVVGGGGPAGHSSAWEYRAQTAGRGWGPQPTVIWVEHRSIYSQGPCQPRRVCLSPRGPPVSSWGH